MRHFVAALLDPHYVACIAAMPDAQDIDGKPHAVYTPAHLINGHGGSS